MSKRVVLMILDGWGISPDPAVSAVAQANTPFVDSLSTAAVHNVLHTWYARWASRRTNGKQ